MVGLCAITLSNTGQVVDDLVIDDGSGTVTILEAYRGLIAADFHPVRAVEFHWYSAEVHTILAFLLYFYSHFYRRAVYSARKPLRRHMSNALLI